MLEQGIGLQTELLRECAIEMEIAEVRTPVLEKRGRSARSLAYEAQLLHYSRSVSSLQWNPEAVLTVGRGRVEIAQVAKQGRRKRINR
jgi:hypothetical protein